MSALAPAFDESKCRIHGEHGDEVHLASLKKAAKREKELHEQRLARIVVDQWMHVARERLTLAWCAQMVHCWQKIYSQSRWSKLQSSITSKHHTCNKFFEAFGALHESNQDRRRNHGTSTRFYGKNTRKKSLRSFVAMSSKDNEYSQQYSMAKQFHPLKSTPNNQRGKDINMQDDDDDDDDSLGKHALHGFSVDLECACEASAIIHWKNFMRAKVLRKWIIIARRKVVEKKQQDQFRTLQTQTLLKRCVNIWHSSTKQLNTKRWAEVARENELWSICNKLMKERWTTWIPKETKANELRNNNNNKRSIGTMTTRRHLVSEKESDQQLSLVAERYWRKHTLHSNFTMWQEYKIDRKRVENDILKALDHLKKTLTQKTWDAWRSRHQKQISKARDLKEASQMYKTRLQRWGYEHILAMSLMLQALQLQSAKLATQPQLAATTYLKVAPYARRWWYLSQKHRKQRKLIHYKKAESSTQVPEMEDSSHKVPTMREVLLRISIVEENLQL